MPLALGMPATLRRCLAVAAVAVGAIATFATPALGAGPIWGIKMTHANPYGQQGVRDPYTNSGSTFARDSAGDDYEKLLKATDAWFNAQMDRVSGWYRRQTQYVLIGIAALVVIGTGLDSIEVGKHLYATPIALSAAAASIQGAFPNGQADPAKLQAAYTTVLAGENMQQFLHPLFADFGSHYPGMFATLIALSLGTPFWFDALGKLVNVRMTGAKPASTPPSSAT